MLDSSRVVFQELTYLFESRSLDVGQRDGVGGVAELFQHRHDQLRFLDRAHGHIKYLQIWKDRILFSVSNNFHNFKECTFPGEQQEYFYQWFLGFFLKWFTCPSLDLTLIILSMESPSAAIVCWGLSWKLNIQKKSINFENHRRNKNFAIKVSCIIHQLIMTNILKLSGFFF